MTEITGSDIIDQANAHIEDAYEEPMALSEFVEQFLDNPLMGAHASKYLLAAIEHCGRRTVIEEGEEKERWQFFDDPWNDGEHAVLGNTDMLNAFVADLRTIAAGRGKAEKIVWFSGATATGKSELKRCLVNGLREFSKTEEGRRYTLEWNITGAASDRNGMTYGDPTPDDDDDDWYLSPVQVNPLSVLPEDVRKTLLDAVNEDEETVPVRVDSDLDPFSREAYEYLEDEYRRQNVDNIFEAVTDPAHMRVRNYIVDETTGIGILHSEDEGQPKQRLVGSWMRGMLQELDSRGRKNPQAFSYDGVLSQGNGLLTIVEDAAQHADMLYKLLNVPDEQTVKLDKGIKMDIDTQLIIISNPDLDAKLNQHADQNGADPLKALKRRLDRRQFRYLTNLSLETLLLHRELTEATQLWQADTYDDLARRIRQPVMIRVDTDVDGDGHSETVTRELAPHTLEAAALYSVVTRLDETDLPSGLDLVDKALLYDQGYLHDGDERLTKDDFEESFNGDSKDGKHGIPVTYTRDTIASQLQQGTDRAHAELDVEHVVMPRDVLDAMANNLSEAPVFSQGEATEFEERVTETKNYIFNQQEADVLDAVLREHRVSEETVEEYLEHVYAWQDDSTVTNDRGEAEEPDALVMKVFETEHLGRFSEDDYDDDHEPSDAVREYRQEKILNPINRHAWEQRSDEFRVDDINPRDIPVIRAVLESNDWEDVKRLFEDFDPSQWENPAEDTETAEVKAATIQNMQEMFDYSPASAELTSQHVMNQVSYRWD